MDFTLNERLASGGFEIGKLHGCRILLKNEAQFPWVILVPEVAEEITDLHQLDDQSFDEVMLAVKIISRFVESYFSPEKLNVACIGNVVRQMHIHVVARSSTDAAWPDVVWAFQEKQKYTPLQAEKIVQVFKDFIVLSAQKS